MPQASSLENVYLDPTSLSNTGPQWEGCNGAEDFDFKDLGLLHDLSTRDTHECFGIRTGEKIKPQDCHYVSEKKKNLTFTRYSLGVNILTSQKLVEQALITLAKTIDAC